MKGDFLGLDCDYASRVRNGNPSFAPFGMRKGKASPCMSHPESKSASPTEGASAPRFDFPAAMHIVSHDEAMLKDILRNYLKYCPRYIGQLKQALSANELSEATRVAHSLKGSSANIGARRVSQLAVSLEYHLRGGGVAAASKILKEIETEMNALVQILEAYITG